MKTFSAGEILIQLKTRVRAVKSQKRVATDLKFPPSFINDVLHGRRSLTVKLAEALGFEKLEDRYRKLNGKAE